MYFLTRKKNQLGEEKSYLVTKRFQNESGGYYSKSFLAQRGFDLYPFNRAMLANFLYYGEFIVGDEKTAKDFFEPKFDRTPVHRSAGGHPDDTNSPNRPGACSSIYTNGFYIRHFDWFYNNECEFVIKTYHTDKQYASYGLAGGFSQLTNSYVIDRQHIYEPLYKLLYYQMKDGVNEYGVKANYNVVIADGERNVVKAAVESVTTLPALAIVRYILDNFQSATEAVEDIRDYCDIYFPKALHAMDYEIHVMVSDTTGKTYCLEFANDRTIVIDISDHPLMTNCYLKDMVYGVEGGSDLVYTPATQDGELNAVDYNHVDRYGSGLERLNLMWAEKDSVVDFDSAKALSDKLMYTRAYPTSPDVANPAWLTEFVGGNRFANSPITDFDHALEVAGQMYLNRSRNTGDTWQSNHAVIYEDISTTYGDKYYGIVVRPQETNSSVEFKMPNSSKIDPEPIPEDRPIYKPV